MWNMYLNSLLVHIGFFGDAFEVRLFLCNIGEQALYKRKVHKPLRDQPCSVLVLFRETWKHELSAALLFDSSVYSPPGSDHQFHELHSLERGPTRRSDRHILNGNFVVTFWLSAGFETCNTQQCGR